jgi:hypothetical protein
MSKIFKIIVTILVLNIPFVQYMGLREMVAAHDLSLSPSATHFANTFNYVHHTIVEEVLVTMEALQLYAFLELVEQSPVLAVMVDESADIVGSEVRTMRYLF